LMTLATRSSGLGLVRISKTRRRIWVDYASRERAWQQIGGAHFA
jgi:hypothetical protein